MLSEIQTFLFKIDDSLETVPKFFLLLTDTFCQILWVNKLWEIPLTHISSTSIILSYYIYTLLRY